MRFRSTPAALAIAICLTACTNPILRRASTDLGCPQSSVRIEAGAAGLYTARGCDQVIEYACSETRRETVCIEQRRDWTGTGPRVARGNEDGSCFANDTCMDPLVCIQKICVRPHEPGQLAGPCNQGACDLGLACINARCEPAPTFKTGAKGGACYPNATCNDGLMCKNGVCSAG